jgi:hypothetical protein
MDGMWHCEVNEWSTNWSDSSFQNGAGAVSLELFSLYSALLSDNTFLNNTGTQTGAILVNPLKLQW